MIRKSGNGERSEPSQSVVFHLVRGRPAARRLRDATHSDWRHLTRRGRVRLIAIALVIGASVQPVRANPEACRDAIDRLIARPARSPTALGAIQIASRPAEERTTAPLSSDGFAMPTAISRVQRPTTNEIVAASGPGMRWSRVAKWGTGVVHRNLRAVDFSFERQRSVEAVAQSSSGHHLCSRALSPTPSALISPPERIARPQQEGPGRIGQPCVLNHARAWLSVGLIDSDPNTVPVPGGPIVRHRI